MMRVKQRPTDVAEEQCVDGWIGNRGNRNKAACGSVALLTAVALLLISRVSLHIVVAFT